MHSIQNAHKDRTLIINPRLQIEYDLLWCSEGKKISDPVLCTPLLKAPKSIIQNTKYLISSSENITELPQGENPPLLKEGELLVEYTDQGIKVGVLHNQEHIAGLYSITTKGNCITRDLSKADDFVIAEFPNRTVYTGQWKDGKSHGYGKMAYPDGVVYYGEFKQNVMQSGICLIPLSSRDQSKAAIKIVETGATRNSVLKALCEIGKRSGTEEIAINIRGGNSSKFYTVKEGKIFENGVDAVETDYPYYENIREQVTDKIKIIQAQLKELKIGEEDSVVKYLDGHQDSNEAMLNTILEFCNESLEALPTVTQDQSSSTRVRVDSLESIAEIASHLYAQEEDVSTECFCHLYDCFANPFRGSAR